MDTDNTHTDTNTATDTGTNTDTGTDTDTNTDTDTDSNTDTETENSKGITPESSCFSVARRLPVCSIPDASCLMHQAS